MAGVPTDVSCERIIRVLAKAGFTIVREGKHCVMGKGELLVVVPRHHRIKRETLRDIIKDACMTIEQFKKLL